MSKFSEAQKQWANSFLGIVGGAQSNGGTVPGGSDSVDLPGGGGVRADGVSVQENRLQLLFEQKSLQDKLNMNASYFGREADEARLEEINRKLGVSSSLPASKASKPTSIATGSITISVKDALTQKPVKTATVTVDKVDSVKNESEYTFMEVPAGTYPFTCIAKDYGIYTKSVSVTAGKDTPLLIPLIAQSAVKDEIEKGEKQIARATEKLSLAVETFYKAYRQGLLNFGIAMLDEEVEDSEAKSLLEVAFLLLAPIATFAFPEGGIVVAAIKKLGGDVANNAATALKELSTNVAEIVKDRQNAPTGGRAFREYMKSLGDSSVPNEKKMLSTAQSGRDQAQEVYGEIARKESSTTGIAVQFLETAIAAAKSLTNVLDGMSDPNKLEEQFATEFANKKGQTPKRTSVLDSTRDAGTLYFEITTVTEMNAANPGFFLGNDTDKKWKLVMLGNDKDAKGAARALKESVKVPWKIAMPRKVKLDIYDEMNEKDRRMCGGWMVFNKGNTSTKPDSYEGLEGSYWGGPIGKKPEEWIKLAWSNLTIQAAALANEELEGSTS